MAAPSTYQVVGKDVHVKDVEEPETSSSDEESDGDWRLAGLGIVLCLFHLMATYPLPDALVFKEPVNHPYHHMRLTVFFGFGFPFLLQFYSNCSLHLQPLVFMVAFWLVIQSILLGITGLYLQMTLALGLLAAVLVLTWPLHSAQWVRDFTTGAYQHMKDPTTKLRLKIYTVIFSIFPWGLVMPIFGPWDREKVELWYRWHPYNVDTELLWRGTFATFMVAFLVTAANPISNNSIVAFFAAHGVCHSISMFIDNRLVPADGNDNLEHLLEISIFMAIGLFHYFVGRVVWYC